MLLTVVALMILPRTNMVAAVMSKQVVILRMDQRLSRINGKHAQERRKKDRRNGMNTSVEHLQREIQTLV